MTCEPTDMAEKKNQISLVDFSILQFFYMFQSVYNNILGIFKWDFWKKQEPVPTPPPTPTKEKRHFIQLYKTEPKEEGEQPICYMNVIEFDSSFPEEEIRKRKRSYDFQNSRHLIKYKTHQRTRSDNDLQYYCSNLRY